MRVLIIGLGSIANKHIHALRTLCHDIDIYALRSGIIANEIIGVKNIYSLNDLPDAIDFVIISNSTNLHFETILKMIEYNIPMFIEKPVVHDLQSAVKLNRILNYTNTFNYVACNLRFNPCLQFLKSELNDKFQSINEVNVYCGSFLPEWRPGKDFRQIYSTNSSLGGGVNLDLFHELDYTCWIFGLPNQNRGYNSSCSTLGISSADYANYLLSYNNFNVSIVLNYYRRKAKRTIEILFEHDTWTVDLLKNTIQNDQGEIIIDHHDFEMPSTYLNQLSYFITCLETKRMPMNTISESLEILKICLDNE
jgi:predicted dehydrogenase